jgi:hypothetical protein
MDGFTIFMLIWGGFCVYGAYIMIRDRHKKIEKKKPTYEETVRQINIIANSTIGKSVEENRKAMRWRDGHWF